MDKELFLVHVGKCGGGTVRRLLKQNFIDHRYCHAFTKPVYSDNYKYLILTRDPIDRFISCWNWRYYLLKNQIRSNRHPLGVIIEEHELKILEYYSSIDNFAKAINNDEDNLAEICGLTIGHVYQGFFWYLEDLLPNLKPENINVIRTKFLSFDFENIYKIKAKIHDKKNYPKICPSISMESRMILKDFFSKEYRIIRRLQELVDVSTYPVNILE